MSALLQIAAIMRTDVPAVTPSTPIRRAVAVLVDKRSPAVPVVREDGTLIGILTQKDCFEPALHASYHNHWTGTVAQHMSEGAITVDAADDIISAAEMFQAHSHRVFPVLQDGKLVGLLDRTDALRALTHAT